MTSHEEYNANLFRYLNNTPTAFHAIHETATLLSNSGYTELREDEPWDLQQGGAYFTIREGGALIAFTLGTSSSVEDGFRMIGTHCDSPGLQLKPKAGIDSSPYLQVGVEIYGGPLLNPWFDRDLSLAGRVCCVDENGSLLDLLVDFNDPILTIPSLAIHFDRQANEGRAIDKQIFLPPLASQVVSEQLPDFHEILSRAVATNNPDVHFTEILGFDLFCYDTQKAAVIGLNKEFIASGRLDNLLSCHAAVESMSTLPVENNTLFLCTNHEENGSVSATGAQGNFLEQVLVRIIPQPEKRHISLRKSFFISIDNAHAVHPNFKDHSEPNHTVTLNGGPVIKINSNLRYTSNSRSAALYKLLAREVDVSIQEFVMRTGQPCGSTIGPMTAAKLGVEAIDIGAPTLAMHSIRELTGTRDPWLLFKTVHHFLQSPTALNRRKDSY